MKLRLAKKLARRGDARARKHLDRLSARYLRRACRARLCAPYAKPKRITSADLADTARKLAELQGIVVQSVEMKGEVAHVRGYYPGRIDIVVLTGEV